MVDSHQKIAESLGRFVASTSFAKLPVDIVEAAKARVLDFLGIAVYGSARGWYNVGFHQPLFHVLAECGGKGECTIIGESLKLPALSASFINSSMGLPLSDTSRFSGAHPGVAVTPAALAVAESQKVGGEEFITAVVAGYEVFLRIGKAVFPSNLDRGFHPTSIVGPFGSAAASSRVLKLNERDTTSALSLAGSFAAGLMESFGGYNSALIQTGRASQSGVLAALLAQQAVVGSSSILEGGGAFEGGGFARAFADSKELDVITQDLNKSYVIPEAAMKIYDGCRHTHAALDATIELMDKYKIKKEDVREINVRTYSTALNLDPPSLETGAQAKFSISFMIAAAILDGEVLPETFSDEKIRDKGIQQFMKKVKVELGPEIEKEYPQKWGASVELRTTQDMTYNHRLSFAKGEPEHPLSTLEIQNKFRKLTRDILRPTVADKIIAVVADLESVREISELTTLLGK